MKKLNLEETTFKSSDKDVIFFKDEQNGRYYWKMWSLGPVSFYIEGEVALHILLTAKRSAEKCGRLDIADAITSFIGNTLKVFENNGNPVSNIPEVDKHKFSPKQYLH